MGKNNGTITILDEIIKNMEQQSGENIQKFNAAQSKVKDILKKRNDYSDLLERLKSDLKSTFEISEDVETAVKSRRKIQKEISETEEIVKGIDDHFLPSAKDAARVIAEKITGIFNNIVSEIQKKKQGEIDELFDAINSIINSFKAETENAAEHFFKVAITDNFSPEQRAIWRMFDLSHAPHDISQNLVAGNLVHMARK